MTNITTLPATKPHIVVPSDGRIAFPGVVLYRVDGRLHGVPPLNGRSYTIEVRDLERFEAMTASGELRLGHAYLKAPALFDNRSAAKG